MLGYHCGKSEYLYTRKKIANASERGGDVKKLIHEELMLKSPRSLRNVLHVAQELFNICVWKHFRNAVAIALYLPPLQKIVLF